MPKEIVSLKLLDNYFKSSTSLKSYLGNVRRGQPKVYETPFARGESTKSLLSKWDKVLVSIKDKWPSLYSYEQDLRSKVGPMSIMKPLKERMADIESYYEDVKLPSSPISDRAIKAVIAEWKRIKGMHVRSQRTTVDLMKKSTNSGSPYFTKRRNVVDDTIPCVVYPYKRTVAQILNKSSWDACAILGWRGQEGGPSEEDTKQRVVWMFPFAVNIRELQVYQPLIELAQRENLVPAWVSMEAVDREITLLFDTKNEKDLIVCTDFSKFDQHFNKSLQDAAYSVLSSILTKDATSSDWLRDVFPVKYMIPLALSMSEMRFGLHGMGSGSGGTNADETLAHRCLQYEAAQKSKSLLNPHSMCLGDDGIISYPGITVDDVVHAYSSHGQEMNKDKQYASTQDCIYLRRWHHKDYRVGGICVGVYSTYRALGRLRYLERYQNPKYWSDRMVALRQLSILENVKYHPLKEQFVEFCMKRDKYRLGIDIPGFLDNIEAEAQKAIEHMPDFLGYTKTLQLEGKDLGIGDWWIVKYLKSHK
ncbi:RNA-dependent RNA polymerase [Chicken picobirnavirus]|uniref:RNA-dependent RNA polymerase n=1 Tax=Chicken picobirnavirus TaxID=1930304 RepID=UPI000EB66A70|nr:RNA-dependent RNA polymerase [Chicken picobirnavirus]AXY55127.1 RNA-dependent RNA polymerase [Chicken picobirnavirus]